MSIKNIVIGQYRDIVGRVGNAVADVSVPQEGWIKTVRKALNMSVAQLAKRLEVTRAYIYKAETAEQSGGLTLKKMNQVANAMDCRFVYAIVPRMYPYTIEEMVSIQAKKMAIKIVKKTNTNMALEAQALSLEGLEKEIDRVAEEILRNKPSDIWNKK